MNNNVEIITVTIINHDDDNDNGDDDSVDFLYSRCQNP